MSFILDALKKSELERQRQNIPGLVDGGIAATRRRWPWWALGLGALLAVNLLVLTVVLLRDSPITAVPAPAATPGTATPGTATPADAAGHFSPLDTGPVYAPEVPLAAEKSMPAEAHTAARVAPQSAPEPTPQASQASQADLAAQDEVLPSVGEIDPKSGLPELHLDVHVYATRPTERFVYINMRRYKEGSTLQEGPRVERIRRDGVVLDYRGLRFLLPRQ